MPLTYEPIATTTLGSAQATVTFSSISGSYTDLVLVMAFSDGGTGGGQDILMRFNSDSGSNYSRTFLIGDGSAATSGRTSNATSFAPGGLYTNSMYKIQIQNYSNTTTNKTVISDTRVSSTYAASVVGLWRSTSAITSITLTVNAGFSYQSGSTFTLYGIKAA